MPFELAKEIFRRDIPQARFGCQRISDWKGSVPLPEEIQQYYEVLGPLDVTINGYGNPYHLPRLSKLWDYQKGYRYDTDTLELLPGWDEDWLVIADEGADPFIYSLETGLITVAQHGQGSWEPEDIFDSIEHMVTTFAILGSIVERAGCDGLTDENCNLLERWKSEAARQLATHLGSKRDADSILCLLGWGGDGSCR